MITLIRQQAPPVIIGGNITGTKNNSNRVFYTEYTYLSGQIHLEYNGQILQDNDFDETGEKEITLKYIAPWSTDILKATYRCR